MKYPSKQFDKQLKKDLEVCHSPKVELPELNEKTFPELFRGEIFHKLSVNFSPDQRTIIYDILRQTLSHSTTQLVEKIVGECKWLEKDINFSDVDDIVKSDELMKNSLSEARFVRMGFNQALALAIKIISKYK
jgi:hypothetical protein